MKAIWQPYLLLATLICYPYLTIIVNHVCIINLVFWSPPPNTHTHRTFNGKSIQADIFCRSYLRHWAPLKQPLKNTIHDNKTTLGSLEIVLLKCLKLSINLWWYRKSEMSFILCFKPLKLSTTYHKWDLGKIWRRQNAICDQCLHSLLIIL